MIGLAIFSLLLLLGLTSAETTKEILQCLRNLYNTAGGPEWLLSDNWASGDYPCEFYGISCHKGSTRETYSIEAISLAGNNLHGELPDCLANNYFALNSLDVGGNSLTGPIPSLNPVNIYALSFKNNNFNKLPDSLCQMTGLRFLHLDSNFALKGNVLPTCLSLSGPKLPQLSVLSIVDCGLIINDEKIDTGIIETVNVGGNQFTNGLLTGFNAAHSTILDFSGCQIRSFGNNIANLGDVIKAAPVALEIDLQVNNFGSNANTNFLDLSTDLNTILPNSNLTVLDLGNNDMNQVVITDILQLLKNLPRSIVVFNLRNTKVAGMLPAISEDELFSAAGKPNLIAFDIAGTQIKCNPGFRYTRLACVGNNIHKEEVELKPAKKDTQHEHIMEVFAFSRCPDYQQIVEKLINPAILRYSYVFNKLNIKYRTLSKKHERYFTGIWAMHGQVEAMGDSAMFCMLDVFERRSEAEISNFSAITRFMDINVCIYNDGLKKIPNNIDMCIRKYVGDESLVKEIDACRFGGLENPNFKRLIEESEERKHRLSSSWSPSLYLDDTLLCLYNAPCKTETPLELAKTVCALKDFANEGACTDLY